MKSLILILTLSCSLPGYCQLPTLDEMILVKKNLSSGSLITATSFLQSNGFTYQGINEQNGSLMYRKLYEGTYDIGVFLNTREKRVMVLSPTIISVVYLNHLKIAGLFLEGETNFDQKVRTSSYQYADCYFIVSSFMEGSTYSGHTFIEII